MSNTYYLIQNGFNNTIEGGLAFQASGAHSFGINQPQSYIPINPERIQEVWELVKLCLAPGYNLIPTNASSFNEVVSNYSMLQEIVCSKTRVFGNADHPCSTKTEFSLVAPANSTLTASLQCLKDETYCHASMYSGECVGIAFAIIFGIVAAIILMALLIRLGYKQIHNPDSCFNNWRNRRIASNDEIVGLLDSDDRNVYLQRISKYSSNVWNEMGRLASRLKDCCHMSTPITDDSLAVVEGEEGMIALTSLQS